MQRRSLIAALGFLLAPAAGACSSSGTGGAGGVAGDAGTCVPKTCTVLGKNCGAVDDGCGRLLDCGTCSAGETCGGSGDPNVCGAGGGTGGTGGTGGSGGSGATGGTAGVGGSAGTGGVGGSADWPTYLHDPGRTSTAPAESVISPSTAPNLKLLWTFHTGGTLEASPIIVGSTLYIGSWDGYEYAIDAKSGAPRWKSPFLGQTDVGNCNGYPALQGISSTATFAGGKLYVGGGGAPTGQPDTRWYALDAATGRILWSIDTGSVAGGYYNWASPLIYNGAAYVNTASAGNCPSSAGAVLRVDLNSHTVTHTWNAVASGEIGGALWSSPTLDASSNTVFVTTGTPEGSGTMASQIYTNSIIALDASTLALKGHWQVPTSEAIGDSDFGAGATLFEDSNQQPLVGAANKDGYFYAINRSTMQEVWEVKLDNGGYNPVGSGSISPAAIANGVLYIGAGDGSLYAVTTDGKVLWSVKTAGDVLGAATYANGVVVDGAGDTLEVRRASDGTLLYNHATDPSAQYNLLETSPVIWNGRIYEGSADHNLYVFGL